MNDVAEFMNYTLVTLFILVGGGYILFDAWRDRRTDADRCCPPACGCDFCYYGIGEKKGGA